MECAAVAVAVAVVGAFGFFLYKKFTAPKSGGTGGSGGGGGGGGKQHHK